MIFIYPVDLPGFQSCDANYLCILNLITLFLDYPLTAWFAEYSAPGDTLALVGSLVTLNLALDFIESDGIGNKIARISGFQNVCKLNTKLSTSKEDLSGELNPVILIIILILNELLLPIQHARQLFTNST